MSYVTRDDASSNFRKHGRQNLFDFIEISSDKLVRMGYLLGLHFVMLLVLFVQLASCRLVVVGLIEFYLW